MGGALTFGRYFWREFLAVCRGGLAVLKLALIVRAAGAIAYRHKCPDWLPALACFLKAFLAMIRVRLEEAAFFLHSGVLLALSRSTPCS